MPISNVNILELDVPAQTIYFLVSIFFGFLCGLYYEAFRFIRIAFKHFSVIIVIEDLFYFLSSCILFIVLIFCAGDGTVRGYAILGVILGFSFYYFTIGKIMLKFSEKIISVIKSFLLRVFLLLSKPFLKLYNIFKPRINKIYLKIKSKIKSRIDHRRLVRIKRREKKKKGGGIDINERTYIYEKESGIFF